jgi:two-component system phosphate regulon response regulator PhoB
LRLTWRNARLTPTQAIIVTGARLLLVEDDPALVELITWHMRRDGYHVQSTGNGETALTIAGEMLPDLILLDWMIEGLPGIDVCQRLRADPSTAHIPIIMLTARSEDTERAQAHRTGADHYVTKPFSPRALMALVGQVLAEGRT